MPFRVWLVEPRSKINGSSVAAHIRQRRAPMADASFSAPAKSACSHDGPKSTNTAPARHYFIFAATTQNTISPLPLLRDDQAGITICPPNCADPIPARRVRCPVRLPTHCTAKRAAPGLGEVVFVRRSFDGRHRRRSSHHHFRTQNALHHHKNDFHRWSPCVVVAQVTRIDPVAGRRINGEQSIPMVYVVGDRGGGQQRNKSWRHGERISSRKKHGRSRRPIERMNPVAIRSTSIAASDAEHGIRFLSFHRPVSLMSGLTSSIHHYHIDRWRRIGEPPYLDTALYMEKAFETGVRICLITIIHQQIMAVDRTGSQQIEPIGSSLITIKVW